MYDAISRWVVYHFHDTSDSAPMRQSEIVEDCAYLREDAANIAPFLKALREDGPEGKKSYGEIVDAVRLVMPFLDDFTLTPICWYPVSQQYSIGCVSPSSLSNKRIVKTGLYL